MALASNPFIPADGTIEIQDASGTPIVTTVQYEDGDFSVEGLRESQFSVQEFYDRGVMYAYRKIKEEPISFSFTAHATDFLDATEKTVLDAFLKTGAFAAGVSQFGASADVWAVKVTFTAEQTDYGAASDSTVVLTYCVAECSFAEGTPGKFSIKGTAYLSASAGVTRT